MPLKAKLLAERAASTIDVKSLALRLAELNLTAKGTIENSPGGAIDLQIDSDKAPLAGWDKLLPAFTGHQVSGTAEVHVRAKGKMGSSEAPQLNGTVALIDFMPFVIEWTDVEQPHSGWIRRSAPLCSSQVCWMSIGRMPA